MAPIKNHTAEIATLQRSLLERMMAPGAPSAGAADPLMAEIKKQSAAYFDILKEDRTKWNTNVTRLENIYRWGCALGDLIVIADDDPKEGRRIQGEITTLRDKLQEFYDEKASKLSIKPIKQDYEMIPDESEVIIKELFRLHIRLDLATEKDFESKYEKYNVRTDLGKVHQAYGSAELKHEEVISTITFFVYHLAILIMFRNGLQQGIKKTDEETRNNVMFKELYDLSKAVGNVFKELEAMLGK